MTSRPHVIGVIMKPGISRIMCRIALAYRDFCMRGVIAACMARGRNF
jgi:hypothetical protein